MTPFFFYQGPLVPPFFLFLFGLSNYRSASSCFLFIQNWLILSFLSGIAHFFNNSCPSSVLPVLYNPLLFLCTFPRIACIGGLPLNSLYTNGHFPFSDSLTRDNRSLFLNFAVFGLSSQLILPPCSPLLSFSLNIPLFPLFRSLVEMPPFLPS